MKKQLEAIYLDYVNNYLTIEKFAGDYGISSECATLLLTIIKEEREKQIEEKEKSIRHNTNWFNSI